MGYKMIEITSEQSNALMEHANEAYEHIGKMLECLEDACSESDKMGERMGHREDEEWNIRRMNRDRYGRYGERYYSGREERKGYRGDSSGMRDPYYN